MKDNKSKVYKILEQLDRDGVLSRFPGNCVLASDIIQNLLDAEGIPSKIMEVQVVITQSGSHTQNLMLLGYDTDRLDPGHTDTHVVVITQTDAPMLIDASIGHLLGNPRAVVVSELSARDPEIVAETKLLERDIVYRVKKNIKLPYFHQRDMLSKMNAEVKLRNEFGFIKVVAVIGLGVGIINSLFNAILIALKVIFP